jgi:hypothetical protein
MDKTIANINKLAIKDMAVAFARNTELKQIARKDSVINNEVDHLQSIFANVKKADIKSLLREEIRVANKGNFKGLIKDLTNADNSEDNKTLTAVKKAVAKNIEAKKKKAEADFTALRGTKVDAFGRGNGKLNTAWNQLEKARVKLENYEREYRAEVLKFGNRFGANANAKAMLKKDPAEKRLAQMANHLKVLDQNFDKAKKAYETLDKQFKKLATFNAGSSNVNGGLVKQLQDNSTEQAVETAAKAKLAARVEKLKDLRKKPVAAPSANDFGAFFGNIINQIAAAIPQRA